MTRGNPDFSMELGEVPIFPGGWQLSNRLPWCRAGHFGFVFSALPFSNDCPINDHVKQQ